MENNCSVTSPSPSSLSLPHLHSRFPSSFTPSPPSSRSITRTPALSFSRRSSHDVGLQWQPLLRFDADDLLSEAPSLLRNCDDLDWENEAQHLRARAILSLDSYSIASNKEGYGGTESDDEGDADTRFSSGVALAGLMLVQFGMSLNAFAAEEQVEAAEAASRAPSWLTPALLAFPIVSYALFSVYRSEVNPYAKVSDWMFGVAAMVIVANLILISTIGVRLY